MNATGLTSAITVIANAILNRFSAEETSLIAATLVQLGDTLATIVTVNSTVNSN